MKEQNLGTATAIGMGAGIALGVALDNLALGIALGLAMAIPMYIGGRKKQDCKPCEANEE